MRPGSDSVARYRAAFAQRNLVQEIEALTARAWPPLTLLDLDGWQLRSAGGLLLRANSAWPRAEGSRLDLATRLRQAEAFYVQGHLDPAVQISPSSRPAGLEAALRRRGYRRTADVHVRTRRLDLLPGLAAAGTAELVEAGAWLPRWAAASAASERLVVMAGRVLERVRPPVAYALVVAGRETAVARGVLDGGWLGIDLLGATSGLRGAGAGAALLAALGRWALAGGGEHAYCEVDEADAAATALTAGAGFRRAYSYRFAVLPRALAAGAQR